MTLLPLTTLPGDERLPTFSPDGSQVAFTWTGEQRDNVDIYIKPLGPGTPLRLTFDPADDLAPAWSPDGSLIAFVRRQGDQAAIYLATPPFQRSEKRLTDFHPTSVVSTLLDPGQWQQLTTISWFPDGKWLAVAAQDAAGQMNGIVAIPVDGGEPRRLMWAPLSVARYHFPAVSPTGAFLAYAACKTSVDCAVNVVAIAGVATRGTPQTLASDVHHGIAWGPGGQSVIYPNRGTGYLERVPVSGGSPERIELAGTPGNEPVTSRTGDTLAFARRIDALDIWKFEAGGTAGPDTFVPLSSTLDDMNPQFSPDGKRVVFVSNRSGQGVQIWVGNSDGTNVIAVTPITGRGQGTPRWSPDGHWIAYDATGEDGIPHIYVVNADGGASRRLSQSEGDERIPSWSRDGKAVYFGSNRSGTWEIYRVPVSGGEPVQMTDNKVRGRQRPQFGSAWESSDGKILYYTTDGALFSKALPDGPEVQIPVSVNHWNFFPTKTRTKRPQ